MLGTVLGTVLAGLLGGVADWMPLLPSSECVCVSYVTVCTGNKLMVIVTCGFHSEIH